MCAGGCRRGAGDAAAAWGDVSLDFASTTVDGAAAKGEAMTLGSFEQLVVMGVMRLGNEAYGARVREELRECAGREASLGAIYTTLDRLEQKGYLVSWRGDADPKRGGRPRRYYRVTGAGRAALREAVTALDRMRAGLSLQPSVGG